MMPPPPGRRYHEEGDVEPLHDLLIGATLSQQPQHLPLAIT